MARFNVPIRNEFLSTDQLRETVLRLANQLGKERDRPTIIAIDGIDHAARAGVDHHSFLETLIPPDGVPKHVRFFIIGQPAEAYDKYPYWLKDQTHDIALWNVEGIKREDIASLLSSTENCLPKDQFDAAVRFIDTIADGNTLAAIFAVHEAIDCQSVQELQEKLKKRQLTSGISAYYDRIWTSALEPLKRIFPFIGYRISGCFSLTSERVTGQALSKIFPEMEVTESEWTNVLHALRPLVMQDEQGFWLTHNDVRVHLTKQVQSEPDRLKEVASRIADYYWNEPEKGMARHADLFKLLQVSGRFTDQALVFTPQYVMEAHALNRPMSELIEQCRLAVKSVPDTEEWECVHTISCAASTLEQLLKSVDWTGGEFQFVSETPPVLLSEGRVPNEKTWNLEIVDDTFEDALRLIQSNELDRARGLMKRWFSNLTPIDLLEILPQNDLYDQWGVEKRLSDSTMRMLRTWGRMSQHVGLLWNKEMDKQEDEKGEQYPDALASFFGGFLEEAVECGGEFRWTRALKHTMIFFWDDVQSCLQQLATQRRWNEVTATLFYLKEDRDICPISFQISAATYSLMTGDRELSTHWVEPVAAVGFDCLNKLENNTDIEEHAVLYCMVSFVLGWIYPNRESGGIGHEGVQHYFARRRDERTRGNAAVAFNASAFAGKWLGALIRNGTESAQQIVTKDELLGVLKAVFDQNRRVWKITHGSKDVSKNLVEVLIECADRVGHPFDGLVFDLVKQHCTNYPVNYMLEIGWRYLADRGEYDLLLAWFYHWCGSQGEAWHHDVAERSDIVERLAILAVEIGFEQEANEALERLKWGKIGYTGHKEYVVDSPLSWFEALAQENPESWDTEGKLLLEISQEASRVGDNRIAYLVDAAVSSAAASCGVSAMWRVYNAQNNKETIKEDPQMLFDGLIGMLETKNVPEQDLLALWAFGIGAFSWQNGIDRCYLSDLRIAILTVAERNGILNLADRMEKMGPAEFHTTGNDDRYRIPTRWFVQSDKSAGLNDKLQHLYQDLTELPVENAIDYLYEVYSDGNTYSSGDVWRGVGFVAKRLNAERPAGFVKYTERLLGLVRSRTHTYRWTYDGVDVAYKELIPLIHERKRTEILRETIVHLESETETRIWVESIVDNLDYLCFYRAIAIGKEALCEGLLRVLSTHELWIHGNGFLPGMQRIVFPSLEQTDKPPISWSQFAVRYLFDVLKTDNGSRIEAGLRGLWGLAEINPSDLGIISRSWDELHPRAKEWILLLAERAAVSFPSAYVPFVEIVKQYFEGEDLKLKLQAWIILQALEENTGIQYPNWDMKKHSAHNQIASVSLENERGVLDIPSIQLGSVHSTSLFNIQKVKKRGGEVIVPASPELYRLMEILYYELYNGRWKHVPPVRLAQALTTSDDPFILLRTQSPAIDKDDWAVDTELEELLVACQDSLKEHLLQHIHAGLSEDEMVVGAVLYSYCRTADVKLIYDASLKHWRHTLHPVPRTGSFNGRTFALYDTDRYDPQEELEPVLRMTYEVGGIGDFFHQSLLCYPSHIWTKLFGWYLSSENPTVWIDENDKPIARLECFHGPVRDLIHDWHFRQPIMQRWVCSREAFDEATTRSGGVTTPSVFVEVNPLKRGDE